MLYLICFILLQSLFLFGDNEEKFEYISTEKNFIEKLKFWQNKQKQVKYHFNQFAAIIPEDLYFIIDDLKNHSILLNRLILYGPPGNGKSTLAHEICQELDAEFIRIDGPSIVNKFQGSGAQNITQSFQKAMEILKFNRKVILFIDEIDSIATTFKEDDRYHDHKSALQTLWLYLDKIKNNPNIFVICATNKFESLDKAFISRFDNNIIELKNPDSKARLNIVEYYVDTFQKIGKRTIYLDDDIVDMLVKNTNGLNIRSIEGIVRIIYQMSLKNKGVVDYSFVQETINKQKRLMLSKIEQNQNGNKLLNALNYISLFLSISLNTILLYNHINEFKEQQTLHFKAKRVASDTTTYLAPIATIFSIFYTLYKK